MCFLKIHFIFLVWDCAWASDTYLFATSSRDKTLKIWKLKENAEVINTATFSSEDAQTAVDFAPKRISDRLISKL